MFHIRDRGTISDDYESGLGIFIQDQGLCTDQDCGGMSFTLFDQGTEILLCRVDCCAFGFGMG